MATLRGAFQFGGAGWLSRGVSPLTSSLHRLAGVRLNQSLQVPQIEMRPTLRYKAASLSLVPLSPLKVAYVTRVVEGYEGKRSFFYLKYVDGAGVLSDSPKAIVAEAENPQQDDAIDHCMAH